MRVCDCERSYVITSVGFVLLGLTVTKSILQFDFPVMLALAILSYPLLITGKRLARWEGAALLAAYCIKDHLGQVTD